VKEQYNITFDSTKEFHAPPDQPETESLTLSYTRNDAGAVKDAIDLIIAALVLKGLDATTVKGAIPRPKSDSFEDSLPYFESKLLHRATSESLVGKGTDSPTRSQFGENGSSTPGASITENENGLPGFFSKFRKPGSMASFSSLIDRRKNGGNSPASLFKHASSNASKASLASLESQGSGYRNPWNDSGINLPEEDIASTPQSAHGPGSHNWPMPSATPQWGNAMHSSVHGPLSNHGPPGSAGPSGPHGPHLATVSHGGPVGAPHPGPMGPMPGQGFPGFPLNPGDTTPTSRYDPRASVDSGRPSTSHSLSGYPLGPVGHHR
jgi:hypothetical protein